jgi:hypothetical protein
MALGGNGQHCDSRENCEDRHQQENGALRKCITDCARHQGDGDISGMIEGRIPSHLPRQEFPGE